MEKSTKSAVTRFLITESLEIGEGNALSASELCQLHGVDCRTLRAQIQTERRQGSLICSSSRGYFLPASNDEIRAFDRRERSQALSRLRTLKSFRKVLKEAGDNE